MLLHSEEGTSDMRLLRNFVKLVLRAPGPSARRRPGYVDLRIK